MAVAPTAVAICKRSRKVSIRLLDGRHEGERMFSKIGCVGRFNSLV